MLLTIKKKIEEEIELKTPAYFKCKDGLEFFKITDNEVICIRKTGIRFIKKDDFFFKASIEDAIYQPPSTEAEFTNALNSILSEINILTNNAQQFKS